MPTLNIKVNITHKVLNEELQKLGFVRSERNVIITHGIKKGKSVNDNRTQKIVSYKHKKGKGELILAYTPLNRLVSDSDYINVKNYTHYNNILNEEKLDKLFLKYE